MLHARIPGNLMLASFGLLAGCAPSAFPVQSAEERRPLIVQGEVLDARDLKGVSDPQNDCPRSTESICVAIPFFSSFELAIRVERILHGSAKVPQRLWAATTSHYGPQSYTAADSRRRLFFLVTDGRSFILPRYQSDIVEPDKEGRWAVPIWNGHELWWLPCAVQSLKHRVDFDAAVARKRSDSLEALRQHDPEGFRIVHDDEIIPVLGVYLDDVAAVLARETPGVEGMACEN